MIPASENRWKIEAVLRTGRLRTYPVTSGHFLPKKAGPWPEGTEKIRKISDPEYCVHEIVGVPRNQPFPCLIVRPRHISYSFLKDALSKVLPKLYEQITNAKQKSLRNIFITHRANYQNKSIATRIYIVFVELFHSTSFQKRFQVLSFTQVEIHTQ
jgi:hypothetical protein